MATTLSAPPSRQIPEPLRPRGSGIAGIPLSIIEVGLALTTTLPALRLVRPLLADPGGQRSGFARLVRSTIAFLISGTLTGLQLAVTCGLAFAGGLGLYFLLDPSARASFDFQKFMTAIDGPYVLVRSLINVGIILATVLCDRSFLDSFYEIAEQAWVLRNLLRIRIGLTKAIIRVGSTMILMGLSLLPLSALLLALPVVSPSEAVLTDVVAPSAVALARLVRRAGGLITAAVLLVALLAFVTELVTRLHLPGDTFYGTILRKMLPDGLLARLPFSLIEHWPYVLLSVYLLDLVVLIGIAKVPLSYSYRNLVVRWHITALTGVAFVVVLFMLTFMLAFVNGMYKLTQDSGVPGNVLIMSDGATDELFSNLGYGDVGNIERIIATEDEHDQKLAKPIAVKTMKRGNKPVAMGSRETYCVINQIIPNTNNNRRRFVQVRIMVDPDVSAAVHNVELLDKSHDWFTSTPGVDAEGRIQCVLGQGVAGTLGPDANKKSLGPGDTFELGDLQWVVTGVMKTEGTTFGSEVWCSNNNQVTKAFGKSSHTSYVLRVSDATEEAAKTFAYHVRNRYSTQKLKAVTEREYFADLNKNNQQTLYAVIVVAVVMAIGGVFGVMNTMYAAIAQRTKDIGILRLLGFKRWQVLVAFLLESMTIAVIGGAVGVMLGYFCNGFEVTSMASSGQGSGKTVAARLIVDHDVVLIGMLFTLVMGRLGGLVPALSAMRLKILESLR